MKKQLTKETKPELCIISFPLLNYVPLAILIQIFEPLAGSITVITGGFPHNAMSGAKVLFTNIKHDRKKQSMLIRIPKYIITQLKISYYLVKKGRKPDIVIFFVGGTGLLFPLLAAKLLKKKIILILSGMSIKCAKEVYKECFFGFGGFIFPLFLSILENFAYKLSDRIVVYSPCVIPQLGLGKYDKKVISKGSWFTDINLFSQKSELSQRRNLIGYFGRLSPEKGVINFVDAIPLVLKQQTDIEFIIGGNGPLFNEIDKRIKNIHAQEKVTLIDWIPHEKMPEYLNAVKLIVIPSYTEGLPNILLEAMACGTPVLATPVGSVPDQIKDEENGFLMKNNSPECIAENMMRGLSSPDLDQIAHNATELIHKEYSYESAIKRYKLIIGSLLAQE